MPAYGFGKWSSVALGSISGLSNMLGALPCFGVQVSIRLYRLFGNGVIGTAPRTTPLSIVCRAAHKVFCAKPFSLRGFRRAARLRDKVLLYP